MPIKQTELERLIREAFPDATFTVKDLAGDDDHYALEIVSAQFQGKSRIEQHKMVHAALQGYVGGTLHALSVKTSAT